MPHDSSTATLYAFAWNRTRRHQLALAGLAVAVAVLVMVPLELQRRIVDSVLADGTREQLIALCAAYLVVALATGGMKMLMNVYRGWVGENVIRDLRGVIRERVGDRSGDGPGSGASVSMMTAEVEPLGEFVGESISGPLVNAGMLLSVFGYMLYTEPLMALVAVGVFVPQLWFVPRLQELINRRTQRRTEVLREAGDCLAEEGGRERFDELTSRLHALRVSEFRVKHCMKFLVNLMSHLGAVGVLLFGGWMVLSGSTEVGTVVAFLSGIERVRDPGRETVQFFRQLSEARVKYALLCERVADQLC